MWNARETKYKVGETVEGGNSFEKRGEVKSLGGGQDILLIDEDMVNFKR